MIPTIDLSVVNTLRNQNLTPAQFNQRYTILCELEEKLDSENKPLSPKSRKELTQLAELVTKSKNTILTGTLPICRLTTPFYWVVFPSAETLKIEKYRNIGVNLNEIPKSSMGVLQAIQPGTTHNWFHNAMQLHINSVFRSDFMDSLRYAFIANVNLIRSSALLTKEPKIFKEVLKIYKLSTDLYEDQIKFNRSVEKNLIESAQSSHRRLENFHLDILEICGPSLEQNDKVLTNCKMFHDEETKKSLLLYTQLEQHCEKFVKKIAKLNEDVTECLTTISSKHETVISALSHMNNLIVQRQQLDQEMNVKRKQLNEEMNTLRKQSNEEMSVKRKQLRGTKK